MKSAKHAAVRRPFLLLLIVVMGAESLFANWKAGKTGETTRLWQVRLAPSPWRIDGPPQRLTTADQDEHSPAISPTGQIVFASRRTNVDVYSLHLDAERAMPNGTLTRLTVDPAIDQRPSLSRDGTKLAWDTSRGGNFEVWVKDLMSGKEKALTSGPSRAHAGAFARWFTRHLRLARRRAGHGFRGGFRRW